MVTHYKNYQAYLSVCYLNHCQSLQTYFDAKVTDTSTTRFL